VGALLAIRIYFKRGRAPQARALLCVRALEARVQHATHLQVERQPRRPAQVGVVAARVAVFVQGLRCDVLRVRKSRAQASGFLL